MNEVDERAAGIEPACSAWKADIMPLYYARQSIPLLRGYAVV